MKEDIQDFIIICLKKSLAKFNLDKGLVVEITVDFPTDTRFGDLSTNLALKLSKILKKPPREVAQLIVDELNKEKDANFKESLQEIRIEGAGFINFYLSEDYFRDYLKSICISGDKLLRKDYGKKKPCLVEFVSANPTGPLSVAHARQAAVGDSLVNILNFSGFRAKKEFYLNDEGNQINILGKSIELRLKELNGEKIEFPEDHYQGEYIIDIARFIKDKGINVKDFSTYGADYILNIIKKELSDFGVKFDCWYSQKALRKAGKIEKALDDLKKKKMLYDQDGALWFKSTTFGDDKDRVVIKSDGSYTYLAPDIAYHREKYRRGFKWLINLWGPDHHGYISRLKASVQALGHEADSLSVIIVQLATIFREGKPVQMSTRRGQYITLQEVLDEVGRDASRFFFLMRRTSSHLDFDLDVAKKQSAENPVFYVQYAHARICSILNTKAQKLNPKKINYLFLKEKEEIALIKKLWQFSSTINICIVTQDPYMLTVYLQELSETFHKFYDLHRVLSDNNELTVARLSLIDATRIVISTGLELLGVSAPSKM